MESSDLSCSAKKKITMSSPLSSSTFFLFLIGIWVIGDFNVKGAYATSTSRSSSDLPYSLPLHGDKMNKHQVRRWKILFMYIDPNYYFLLKDIDLRYQNYLHIL